MLKALLPIDSGCPGQGSCDRNARRADPHRRHGRRRSPHRIGARLPHLASMHRRIVRHHAGDGHPRCHRVRQPSPDLRARARRDPHVPRGRADPAGAPRPVRARAGDRPVRSDPGGHRRHHGADESQPVRRRAALLRLGRARRPRRGARVPGLRGPRGSERVGPPWYRILAHVTSLLVAVTIFAGIITTGSGPHAGDGGAARNGLDPQCCSTCTAGPPTRRSPRPSSWCLLAPTTRIRRFTTILLGIELVQIAIGLTQSRLGLPELLVGIHMVLACCLGAAMTAVVLSLRRSRPVQ